MKVFRLTYVVNGFEEVALVADESSEKAIERVSAGRNIERLTELKKSI